MRPPRSSAASASAIRRAFGVAVGEAARSARDLAFVALRPQRAGGDEGRGGRTADAGVAMDQQRLGAVPSAGEGDQLAHVRFGRQRLPRLRFDDVGDADIEMALSRYGRRPLDRRAGIEQRHQRARAGHGDGFVDPRQRADVNARHQGLPAEIRGGRGDRVRRSDRGRPAAPRWGAASSDSRRSPSRRDAARRKTCAPRRR